MKTRGRIGTITGLVIALVLAPTAAGASRIDVAQSADDGAPGRDMRVWFDCGVGCGNYFDISAGQSASRPGKAGRVEMGFKSGDTGSLGAEWICEIVTNDRAYVAAHGEVTAQLTHRDGFYWGVNWTSIDSDNQVVGSYGAGDELTTQPQDFCWAGAP